jgi:hypothetical protein
MPRRKRRERRAISFYDSIGRNRRKRLPTSAKRFTFSVDIANAGTDLALQTFPARDALDAAQ